MTELADRIRLLAKEYLNEFVQMEIEPKGNSSRTKRWITKSDFSEESTLHQMIYGVHVGFPNDWTFDFIVESLDLIVESDCDEFSQLQDLNYEIEPDVYYESLFDWIANSDDSQQFIEESVNELGLPEPFNFFQLLQQAQQYEKQQVFSQVLDHLRNLAEQHDDEEETSDMINEID